MTDLVPVRRALISLSDKSGLEDLASGLAKHGVEIVSTGGTAARLRQEGAEVRDISDLTGQERDDFTELYLDVLNRFDGQYDDDLPYIAAWHPAPVRVDRELGYLHLELLSIRRAKDKIKYLAGTESGMGAFVTDTLPEEVAETLRKV